jgi:hypothetical protein
VRRGITLGAFFVWVGFFCLAAQKKQFSKVVKLYNFFPIFFEMIGASIYLT